MSEPTTRKMTLTAADICKAVEFWMNQTLLREKSTVLNVEKSNDGFDVHWQITRPETVDEAIDLSNSDALDAG